MTGSTLSNAPESARAITCGCGRAYHRTVRIVGFRDNDAFSRRGCGTVLEEWNGMEIPVYTASTTTRLAR